MQKAKGKRQKAEGKRQPKRGYFRFAFCLLPFAFCLVLALTAPGCSKEGLVKVRGVVTLDGEPLVGAIVTFLPEGDGGRMAHGQTGAGGVFQLTTFKPQDGAMPGAYKVTVQYHEGVETSPATNQRAVFQEIAKGQKTKPPRYVVPAKYSDPGQTPLRQQIPPAGEVTFPLTSN
jgi:hypothetical protein